MKTEMLIESLVQDIPVERKLERSVALAMTAGNIIAGIVFFGGIGFRSDILHAVETTRFLLKFGVTLPLVITATAAIMRAARPGASFGLSGWSLAIAPVVLMSAVLIELMVVPSSHWVTTIVGSNARNCVTLIPVLSIGPLACLLLALREGAPTRPGLAGAIAGLAASSIAATFYATNCTDDSPLFVITWYPLATSVVVMLGYLCGLRFLRW
jgi:hypothetical protein